jgi:hypothetical protein
MSSLRRRSGVTLTLKIPKACIPNAVVDDDSGQFENDETSDSEATTSDEETDYISSNNAVDENDSPKRRLKLGSPASAWLLAFKGSPRLQSPRTPLSVQSFNRSNLDGVPDCSKQACLSDPESKNAANSDFLFNHLF